MIRPSEMAPRQFLKCSPLLLLTSNAINLRPLCYFNTWYVYCSNNKMYFISVPMQGSFVYSRRIESLWSQIFLYLQFSTAVRKINKCSIGRLYSFDTRRRTGGKIGTWRFITAIIRAQNLPHFWTKSIPFTTPNPPPPHSISTRKVWNY